MKKIISFFCISILSMILVGCGDKNTITYDLKTGKATASGFDSQAPNLNGLSYMKIMNEISKNCNLDIVTLATNLNTDGKYTTEVCKNGITYKLINAK
ncbi:hypothetical protein [Gilliamella sp. Occ4-3]|uniref:hypothetical protein n=1 Tax=Gilliamella sp. Occ4-3 TaxID=3120254 RepID=UPI00080DF166|nr:hypothetical protein [Gilliamella apicola]OCG79547.1 hypothetical protein A9G44_11300 [Gilliamella apicola]